MCANLQKVKLKGNESFNIREGWLRKGMRCVAENAELFSSDDAMERLGVGSKMVKSIRFWLQATGLTQEHMIAGRGKVQHITPNFGMHIMEYDPYFDDIFTLWLVHSKIASNPLLCMVWYIFFNEYDGQDFTKEDMIESCKFKLEKKMSAQGTFSDSSFADDCTSIIKMYLESNDDTEPEENLTCPMVELGLLKKSAKLRNAYHKSAPAPDKLDKLAVFYVMLQQMPGGRNSISIDDLVNASNQIGRIFNLNRVQVNTYLDQLRVLDYIDINRTAGLDMVYLSGEYRPQDIMIAYYERAVER